MRSFVLTLNPENRYTVGRYDSRSGAWHDVFFGRMLNLEKQRDDTSYTSSAVMKHKISL